MSASVRSLLRIESKLANDLEPSVQEEVVSGRQDLEAAIGHYLRTTCAYFDTHANVEVS